MRLASKVRLPSTFFHHFNVRFRPKAAVTAIDPLRTFDPQHTLT